MEERDDVTFIDADEYQGTSQAAVTFEQVVLTQIKKCIEEGSKEMKSGYYQEKQTTKGIVDIYVGNQQEIYINSINALYDLLLPHFDEKMQKSDEEFKNKLDDIKKRVNESLTIKKEYIENPKEKARIDFAITTGYLEDDMFESRWSADEKLMAHRFLLQCLILLYNRRRYLMTQDITR